MSTTLHSSCDTLRRSAARASLSLVLMALLSFAASQARAGGSFIYNGSRAITFTGNGSKYISVGRSSGTTSAFTVRAYLSGSSKFSLNNSSVFFPDSTQDTSWNMQRSFLVQFSSSIQDTSVAILLLADSNHVDSIRLTGIGPVTHSMPDFTIYDTMLFINVTRDSGRVRAAVMATVKNELSTPLRLYASPADSVHFNVDGHGGEYLDLSANGAVQFMINFTPHNVASDQTTVYLVETSAPYQRRAITVFAVDSAALTPTDAPTVTLTSTLGTVQPGDTACGTLIVGNHTKRPIVITSVRWIDSTSGLWYSSGNPSLPLTLVAGDSFVSSICFHPGNNDLGLYLSNNLYLTFTDSNAHSGSIGRSITASTPSCLSYGDTLQLDDVIAGGFVEGTTTVFVHKAGTMRYQSGFSNDSGFVTILSPTFPRSVNAGDTVSVRYRYTTRENDAKNFSGFFSLTEDSCSRGHLAAFYGRSVVSADTGLNLFPAQNELIAMTTTQAVTVDTFWFKNNHSGEVHVTGVTLAQGTHFSILGVLPHALPDTLTSSQQLGVIVQFSGDSVGFYHDSLYIVASNALVTNPTVINLEAYATVAAHAGVHHDLLSSHASLFVSPNPATGPVEIAVDGARTATIVVYDLLGGRIMTFASALDASWNADGLAGGAYIVRASGTDVSGNAYFVTKRLILVK